MQIKDILPEVFDLMEEISEVPSESVVLTGYQEIDLLAGGLKPGELILILTGEEELSRAFAQNIIINQDQDQLDHSILVFSPEISKEQYTMQLLSIKSQVNYSTISLANPSWKQSDWDNIAMATDDLSKANIQIIDQRSITVEQLQTQIEKANKKEPLNLIVIDNIESVLVETGDSEYAAFKSKCTESGEFKHFAQTGLWEDDYKVNSLKTLSEVLNIPVVVLSDNNISSSGKEIPKQYSMIEWADLVFEMDDGWKSGYIGAVDINITKNTCGLTGKVGLYYTEECSRLISYREFNQVDDSEIDFGIIGLKIDDEIQYRETGGTFKVSSEGGGTLVRYPGGSCSYSLKYLTRKLQGEKFDESKDIFEQWKFNGKLLRSICDTKDRPKLRTKCTRPQSMTLFQLSRNHEEGGMPEVNIFGIGKYGEYVAKSTACELSTFKGSGQNELLYKMKHENRHHLTDTGLDFFIGDLDHFTGIIGAIKRVERISKTQVSKDIPALMSNTKKSLTIGVIAFDTDNSADAFLNENEKKLHQLESIFDSVIRISKNDLMLNLHSSRAIKQYSFLRSMAQKTIVTVVNSFFVHAGIIGCDFADIKRVFSGHNTAKLGLYKTSDFEKAIQLAGDMIPNDLNKHNTGAVVIVITTMENKLELIEVQRIADLIQENRHNQDADIILQYVCPKEHDDEIEISIIAISDNQRCIE
jgi:hypothetical protein